MIEIQLKKELGNPSPQSMDVQPPSSKKRRRKMKRVDRISEMPDSILIQILSLLPIKDAFTTCVLSKRWQYLWPCIHNLFIQCEDEFQQTNFISFVDYALHHSACSKIKKFHLDFTHLSKYESLLESVDDELLFPISRWVATAVKKNVENLLLVSDLYLGEYSMDLPHSIYSCSSLITLDLTNFNICRDFNIHWMSLKSLKLKHIMLDDLDIFSILSGCPALESLEFSEFRGFGLLEIYSSNLKRLKFEDYWLVCDNSDHFLNIFAPHIQHLEISNDLYDLECRLVDVSSVVSAKLTLQMGCTWFDPWETCDGVHQVIRTSVEDYLQKLSNATKLTVGTWFTQVLMQFEERSLPELKCKCLTLDLHIRKFYFYGAAILLGASPHVETLNINMETTFLNLKQCEFELGYLAKEHDIHFLSSVGFPNLRSVEIVSSSNMCLKEHLEWDHDELFQLSKFLLKNAMGLEMFVIISRRETCWSCSMNCVAQYVFRLYRKLVGCPKSSTNCALILRDKALRDKIASLLFQ